MLFSQNNFEDATLAIQEALDCARDISRMSQRNSAISKISSELAKQGKFEEAIKYANEISDEWDKSQALQSVAIEFAIKENFKQAEKTGLEISQIDIRQECWKSIAKNTKEQLGWKKALEQLSKLQNKETYDYYLKGLAEIINVNDANKECLLEFLPLIMNDTNSIETVLQAYALNEIFLKQPSKELVSRLNRSLNLEWAIDIAAEFEKEFERSIQNVPEWINEIEDENDREDVLSWSEKVAQGKMTEDKFLERISKL
jgi:phosphopantetheinyl transferase (holo-ACP synthase)